MATETKLKGRLRDQVTSRLTLYRALVPVSLIVIWELMSLWIGARYLPGPQATLRGLISGVEGGWVIPNTLVTMEAVMIAFVFATVGGGVIGIILGVNNTAFDIVEPFFLSFYSVPKITLYPIFLFIFGGVGLQTKIGYAGFSAFFPMLIITMGAVRSIDQVYFDVARSLRLSQYQLFRHVILQHILVQLVVALRMTFNGAFLGVILVELFASRSGIGLILQHAMGTFNSEQIMIVITILTVIAFVSNIMFYVAQHWLEVQWNMTGDDIGF